MFRILTLKKHTPRWIILIIDLMISIMSIVFAFLLRFNFDLKNQYFDTIHNVILFVFIIRLFLFLITRSYAGIIRYTGTKDAIRIILVITYSNLFYIISNFILFYFITGKYIIPFSIILIDYFVSIFLMTSFRLTVKTIFAEANNLFKDVKHIIIFGINENAIATKRVLTRDTEIKYKVEAFIDPSGSGMKKQLDGIKFYKEDELRNIIKRANISELIIADKSISALKKQKIIDVCLEYDVNVLTLPDVKDWINGELSYRQIRKINIEDLLERPPIHLNVKQIRKDILNKTILVTGAAGSIGREIVLQLTKFHPKNIIIFDQAESPLYNLELELKEKLNFHKFEIVIGDVTNIVRVNKVFQTYKPDIVYHAAAYKHVPMMENNPSEAVRTNIVGTKTVADKAVEYKVKKFVMVSTDKAVNPTNVMGASKRIAEIYIQTLQHKTGTSFITTRFGNVLGSNGSVIPRFRQQIEEGGPVTVTHPEITRYFMTIPEACQLVLQAGAIGKGGEIFIFNMGKSVKIVDLAKKMIKLSGLKLGTDINLKFTGLRPGEKLYEELLADKEKTKPTMHEKIMIAETRKYDTEKILPKIDTMFMIIKNHDNFEIVGLMKNILPEFISMNSVYESLDE
ncbi:MAG: polysaccharide biosynthesis protein [Bacteroidales bacterium]|nr:polysaccharide biosynthesis protein [Bacteroidales bacterium]